MSSTSTKDLMTTTFEKDQENNMEKYSNMKKRNREDSDVAGTPSKKIKCCNITDSSEKVSVRKRRADDDGPMPGKKIKTSEESVDDFTKQEKGKRKASVDAGTSEKKIRLSFDTISSEPSTRSEEDSLVQKKRKASDDGNAPWKKSRSSSSASLILCPSEISVTHFTCGSSTTTSSEKVLKDGSDEDISHDSSLEEKILEMASSGNGSRAEFENKYFYTSLIGSGGFGSVFAGFRKGDFLPVSLIKQNTHIMPLTTAVCNEKVFDVILEVALMLKSAGLPGSIGQSAAISLLDWYILEDELILVLERPALCLDLHTYLDVVSCSLPERDAKMILRQLVDAAIDMHAKGVFHRDIKIENTLIQRSVTGALRLRVIDFGCGTFSSKMPFTSFWGTRAYAPPEYFSNGAYRDSPTTVWQLGALFYSLLHRGVHFTTTGFIQGRIQIDSELSHETKCLLYMCLARDPALRVTLEELQSCLALQ
ncbi:hypothetical protein PAMA_001996 [Pampus argenteus]